MTTRKLGEIVQVSITDIWKNEATEFTPWLAEQVDLLGRALGIDLEPAQSEVAVGNFRADLMFQDSSTGKPVIVENMYGNSDHDHLGKLLTYVAGLDGSCAVLVAERFRPEHISALAWLNRNSQDNIAFFGIEMELWSINGSDPAPHLNVVVKPDSWSRVVKSSEDGLSNLQVTYKQWWAEFLPTFQAKFPGWSNARSPLAQGWMAFPSGKSGLSFCVVFGGGIGSPATRIRAELYIDTKNAETNLEIFQRFSQQKIEIESRFGSTLDWQELAGKKACRIALISDFEVDPKKQALWPKYREWAIGNLGKIRSAFEPFIQDLQNNPEITGSLD